MAHANLEVMLTSGRLTDLSSIKVDLEVMLTSGLTDLDELIKMSSIKVAHANFDV